MFSLKHLLEVTIPKHFVHLFPESSLIPGIRKACAQSWSRRQSGMLSDPTFSPRSKISKKNFRNIHVSKTIDGIVTHLQIYKFYKLRFSSLHVCVLGDDQFISIWVFLPLLCILRQFYSNPWDPFLTLASVTLYLFSCSYSFWRFMLFKRNLGCCPKVFLSCWILSWNFLFLNYAEPPLAPIILTLVLESINSLFQEFFWCWSGTMACTGVDEWAHFFLQLSPQW